MMVFHAAAALVVALLSDGGVAGGISPPAPADVGSPSAGAIRNPSGLVTKVLVRGRGREHPGPNDCARVHYTAWKRDGSLLSSTRQRGEPENQCLRSAFPGVAQALRVMVVGEQRRLWVPAKLTYPPDDDDSSRPQLDVTFDLELVEIAKAPPTPRHLKKAPRSAHKLPSGLAIEVLQKGTADQHPAGNSQVRLHYSGWTADGRLFQSTVMANHPAVFPMSAVIAGWREALSTMVTGDKVRLWVPQALAYGEKPRRGQPRGDLVYELELLSFK
jgi:FKBP-type peptidyl-prolyl cis-trans isomerase